MNTPLIIGHRGASAVAPENTMAAFREAIAVGADGIEFDVRLTRDGVPVVIHDSTLRRTGGLSQRIADLTWSELAKIDVGSWFAVKKDYRLELLQTKLFPRLTELFTLFQSNNSTLYLEMKCDSPAEYAPLAEACCRSIAEHALKDRVMIECFQLPALRIVERSIRTLRRWRSSSRQFQILRCCRTRALSTKPLTSAPLRSHYITVSLAGVWSRKQKTHGMHVAVWTVDDPAWARTSANDAASTR